MLDQGCRPAHLLVLPLTRLLLALCLAAGVARLGFAAEQVFSNFNGTGFSYTFDNFLATTGPTSVRLYSSPTPDEDPGWGGGGLNFGAPLNLSSFADGRFVVDMTKNAGNGVGSFTLEMYDTSSRSGKWTMSVGRSRPARRTCSFPPPRSTIRPMAWATGRIST